MSIVTTGAQEAMDALWARAETILTAGRGEVRTSIRRKVRGEKRKALHGAFIWNILRSKGHDPGGYDSDILRTVQTHLCSHLEAILRRAGRIRVQQTYPARRLVEHVSVMLSKWARDNIAKGGLGHNTGRYKARKTRLTEAGVFSSKFGTPGPRGFATGRFYDGIEGGWKLGGKERHARRLIVG